MSFPYCYRYLKIKSSSPQGENIKEIEDHLKKVSSELKKVSNQGKTQIILVLLYDLITLS